MSFRPTLALLSKASRLPLSSKKGNKDFYKGTRTPNVLLRKRIALADKHGMQLYDEFGRPATWNKRTHRIDEARVPAYIVPPGLADTPLRPYVYMGPASSSGVPMPAPGYPGGPKMEPKRGLDADYYEAVSEEIWQRREAADGEGSGSKR
ncbi:hypothetical protein FA09DRAFT_321993 [Tilletiopsis washingtonensis]|uniref:Uncharacterized protein n=1 Tax=Tilletiopsis washingtonensis TaxID=58919 RepID=A0A316Z466_9BASI|nr:hypothetical protein FA09DRAFT_321993 [Tilletiopsis washingtonensis]PWN95874.1 hypothetical protein FA09DRAFT_321993 [Tilletiopsis washingtonensis]